MTGHVVSLQTTKTSKGRRIFSECTCGWVGPFTRNAPAAEEIVAEHHPQAFCPTPDKRRYTTQREAELALLDFWQTSPPWKRAVCRVYECACGRWHTTSKPGPVQEDQDG